MASEGRTYCCIDLKSFYASVECVDRGLDPMETRLVVADPDRTEKTICLAVSPALKRLGVPGRCRVFQLPKGVDYVMARPRMRRYMEVSAQIVGIYLRYVSAEDLHVYSVDECFIDLTPYLRLYGMTARELTGTIVGAIREETGIPAAAGIGTNLFLAKVALDVTAKHAPGSIAVLDQRTFRERIWPHRPITDIWGIGRHVARRLAKYGIHDLGGLALADVDLLYREFGVNAEYLVDHAWGIEPCTLEEIHAYEPEATSLGNGQVLPCDYSFEEGRMILREMTDETVLDLVERGMVTSHASLAVGYGTDIEDDGRVGRFGSHASASRRLPEPTNSFESLMAFLDGLYDEIVDPRRPIRRLSLAFGELEPEEEVIASLFVDREAEEAERSRQEAVLAVRQRFGKGALLKGTSLKDKARGIERATQVGGHHA